MDDLSKYFQGVRESIERRRQGVTPTGKNWLCRIWLHQKVWLWNDLNLQIWVCGRCGEERGFAPEFYQ